jgi:hypothetical protein
MTYSEIVTALATTLVTPSNDTGFVALLPSAFAYADNRIYRELDMLASNVRDSSSSTAADNRDFTLPTTLGTFQMIDSINVITPASTAPGSGTRNVLIPVSQSFLDMCWPSTAGATVPQYFSYISQDTYTSTPQNQIIFGPWPDDEYRVEVIGTIQPEVLSSTTTNTFLTDYLSDLYLAACMVFMTGAFLKNFGSQSDDPRSALSWETQYTSLRESAATWEARKRWAGPSWTSKPLEPMAQPQRG